ncbi:hypothetical protein [Oecophyllibacter saccharovorans]|uniref:hypothetical protein n=1 Tax=Oecophyllibacter saccharovorans TaxID=2558360 RepID=UPI001E4DBA1E|nr:hypothetical protein [Oecophyllibacter saccharovorans]
MTDNRFPLFFQSPSRGRSCTRARRAAMKRGVAFLAGCFLLLGGAAHSAQAWEWHARDRGWTNDRPAYDLNDALPRHERSYENSQREGGAQSAGYPAGATMPAQCDNAQFLKDRESFSAQTDSSVWSFFTTERTEGREHRHMDKPEHICGVVMKVFRARRSRSGWHGYFLVNLGNTAPIRIVANLDEMQAPAWPWVRPGDQIEVEGRYYYDNAHQQGIDWTHYGTSRSWPWAGFVVVNGQRYQ